MQIHDTRHIERQAPAHRSYSLPYWQGTKQKKLLVQYDRKVGRYQWYPRPTSRFTGQQSDLEWREISGDGEVYSFTLVRRARPPFQGHEPFFIAVVTMPEDIEIMGNTVGISHQEMMVGLKVKPYWHPLPDGFHMLMWQKAAG
jgi:uncharacterized OB-fold protein